MFAFKSDLQLAAGRHPGTKGENEPLCAPQIGSVRAAEVMEKHRPAASKFDPFNIPQ